MPKPATDDSRTPLVSVVIPVYNGETTIARAVESALAQDYPSLECVVVNDASRDR
ncbi:MAG: glycosyltransferase, partial [Deltaproteobacteria bacterium]